MPVEQVELEPAGVGEAQPPLDPPVRKSRLV